MDYRKTLLSLVICVTVMFKKTRRKCVHNEYHHTEAHMSLPNAIRETDRRYMILGGTEGYFSTLDDAVKRSEKRKIKNQSSKNGSLNQIDCLIHFIQALMSLI